MGITKLLPSLKPIMKRVVLWEVLHGLPTSERVAIDASGWLHAIALHRLDDLFDDTPSYDRVARDFVARHQRYVAGGIDPIYVFDGKPVPAKQETAEKRRERRMGMLISAAVLEGADKTKALKAAVSISPALVGAVIAALRDEGARYIYAPYEADPQLRYLDKCGFVDYVLTVDSDLIALGTRRTLISTNFGSGAARLYLHDDIFHPAHNHNPEAEPLLAAFQRGGPTAMLDYAMGAGCDYCKFTGVGPGRAEAIVVEHYSSVDGTVVPAESSATVLAALLSKATDGAVRPSYYTGRFYGGRDAFLHAIVYDPTTGLECTLSGAPVPSTARGYVGTLCTDQAQCRDSALGFIPAKWCVGMEVFVLKAGQLPSQCGHGTIRDVTEFGVRLTDGESVDFKRAFRDPATEIRLCLPAVLNATRNCGHVRAVLPMEHCPGAQLPPSQGDWNRANMNAWLCTRAVTQEKTLQATKALSGAFHH